MKTPPASLPPIPSGFAYIGIDDGSLDERGCNGGLSRMFDPGTKTWQECRTNEGNTIYSHAHIAAPIISRLHMLNAVPGDFTFLGFVIRDSEEHSDDILVWEGRETVKWRSTPHFIAGSHYALRTGSPIALANGLVPPAEPGKSTFDEALRKAIPDLRKLGLFDIPIPPASADRGPITGLGPQDAKSWSLVDRAVAAIQERNTLAADLQAAQSGNRTLADKNDALRKTEAFLREECDKRKVHLDCATSQALDFSNSLKLAVAQRDALKTELALTVAGEKLQCESVWELKTELEVLRGQVDSLGAAFDRRSNEFLLAAAERGRFENEVFRLQGELKQVNASTGWGEAAKQRDTVLALRAEVKKLLARNAGLDEELFKVHGTLKRYRDVAAEVAAL